MTQLQGEFIYQLDGGTGFTAEVDIIESPIPSWEGPASGARSSIVEQLPDGRDTLDGVRPGLTPDQKPNRTKWGPAPRIGR
jgi:hypothetical protein